MTQRAGAYPPGGFVCEPAFVPADGESTTAERFCLVQEGTTTPVPGHAITFEILSIEDGDGNPVSGPPWPSAYGSVSQPTGGAITGADGWATGTYTAGTEPGTILIKAVDNNDQEVVP